VNTTGNERTRLSVAFSAVADGTKLPLMAIIPRKKRIDSLSELDVVCEYKTGSTFDEEMIVAYLERVVVPYRLNKGFKQVGQIVNN